MYSISHWLFYLNKATCYCVVNLINYTGRTIRKMESVETEATLMVTLKTEADEQECRLASLVHADFL